MSYSDNPHIGLPLTLGRPPWFLFLVLTAVFFFSYHDLSNAKRGIGNYNIPQDDLIANTVNGLLAHRIALMSLGLIAIVSLVRNRANVRLRIEGSLGWLLLAFATWIFISPIWAEDLTLTVRRVLTFAILWIAALAVARRLSLREIILWTFFSTATFLFISILAEVLVGTFRPFAAGYRFSGSLDPNSQGVDCGLLLLSAMAAADIGKRWRALCLACAFLGFIFLILSGSRTSFAAAMLAFLIYLAAVRSRSSKVATVLSLSVAFSFFLLFLGTGLFPDLKSTILLGRDDPGSVDSFNGRTLIWQDLGYYIRQRPLLGYGYGGFWTPTQIKIISEEEQMGISSGHSAYIDYLLTLGPVGLLAYMLLLCSGIRRAFRCYRLSTNPVFAFCGALLVFCALDGLLDSDVTVDGTLLMFLWIAILVRLAFIDLPGRLALDSGR